QDRYWQDPESLKSIYIVTPKGMRVPLSTIAQWRQTSAPLAVNHQGQSPAATISFNLPPGVALGDASAAVERLATQLRMPSTIHGSFQGTAQAFQESLANEPLLILAALIVVYLVLGILYESLIHPVTILSTLPSAGIGAFLGLRLFNLELSVIAMVG